MLGKADKFMFSNNARRILGGAVLIIFFAVQLGLKIIEARTAHVHTEECVSGECALCAQSGEAGEALKRLCSCGVDVLAATAFFFTRAAFAAPKEIFLLTTPITMLNRLNC